VVASHWLSHCCMFYLWRFGLLVILFTTIFKFQT
jgi:hypothetical protein